tara:strand:+ start:9323 stop:11020 length:1698 start_codon:yes stop_codon:yes gene_type:complete
MSCPVFPPPPATVPDTPFASIETAIEKLAENKNRWAQLSIGDRIALLERLKSGVLEQAEGWANSVAQAVGINPQSSGAGEAWLGGPVTTVRNIHLLIETLRKQGQPKPMAWRSKVNGQDAALVFPQKGMDKALFAGFEAEIWIQPGKEKSQGAIYREPQQQGKVSLVLGAGNVSSIGPMDVLYKLFAENEVCVLKMNPVNDYVGPFIEKAFAALIEEGFFAVVYGGAEVGQFLTNHQDIESIHITGSDRTHDAILWGDTAEQQQNNKSAGTPALQKEVTSELGCVTPVFVVPGPWTDKELQFQARHIASMIVHNGSFNCNAAKVLLLPKDWNRLNDFKNALRDVLKEMPQRKAYYPGAQQRYEGFLNHYPDAEPIGERSDDIIPWTIIPNVKAQKGEYAISNEAFCGVVAEVEIEGADATSYLNNAVTFANEDIWGSLSCMMMIHPATQKEHASAFEQAIADLRYGGIGVNVWAGLIYGLVVTTWGAFPGNPLENIGSGRGVVHNSLLFDHPEKSVIYAPFMQNPTPLWFGDHKNLLKTSKALMKLEAHPSWLKVPGVALNAFKG